MIARAVSEALEARAYLTTFNAFLDAPATGHFGSTYSIHLFTSGGQASKWVVDWKDGTTLQTLTPTVGSTTFATDYSVGHTYASGHAPSAAIAATATLSGSSTTAAAVYDLSSTYGTFQFQDAGRSTFSVSGDTITADYTAVDPGTGNEYVAFAYNPGGTSHKLMAVAKFNSQGDIVNSWGDSGAGTGGNGILYFQTNDSGDDTPKAIAVGEDSSGNTYIMVVGSGPNGWLVEQFDAGAASDPGTYGNLDYEDEGTAGGLFAGQATAVWFDTDDAGFDVAGSDSNANDFAAAQLLVTAGGSTFWTKTYTFGTNIASVSVTAVAEGDNLTGGHGGYVFVGGNLFYSGSNASSMAILALNDNDGTLETSFSNYASGVAAYNIGNCSACSASCNSSNDLLYALVPWTTSGGADEVTAVGYTCGAASHNTGAYALETFQVSNGALYSSYGTSGVVVGPDSSGPLRSAVLYTPTGTGHNEIVAAGGSGGDYEAVMFTTSGAVDSTNFGNSSGYFNIDFGTATTNTTDTAYSVFVNADGTIVIGGTEGSSIGLTELLLKQAPSITA